ncbi:TD and POZ domain-containing protein 3-like [Diachasmimorpha longicaudata]|uniref:TD and POZ domain-containing protein 3-like n=1 Tax=Diachasmimorpha longicaudata TaxID=58733 RepID=UPI0030B87D35
MSSSTIIASCLFILLPTINSIAASEPTSVTTSVQVVSGVEAEHLAYKWTIKNVTLHPLIFGCIRSPAFKTQNGNLSFWFKLFPDSSTLNHEYSSKSGTVQLSTYSPMSENATVVVDGNIVMFHSEEIIANVSLAGARIGPGFRGYKFQYHPMSPGLRTSAFNSASTVTIYCNIDMPLKTITKVISASKPQASEPQASDNSQTKQLTQDFRRLLQNENFTDVLLAAGIHRLPAHKFVLAARSPVFADMIKHAPRNESDSLTLRVDYMEVDEVKAMLEYLYTDSISNLTDVVMVRGLLAASNRFQLPGLSTICKNVLQKRLSVDTAANTLVYADRYELDEFKKNVTAFIKDHFQDVRKTKGYKQLKEESPQLLMELLVSITEGI